MPFDAQAYLAMTNTARPESKTPPLPEGDWRAIMRGCELAATKNDPDGANGYNCWLMYEYTDEQLMVHMGWDGDGGPKRRECVYIEKDESGGVAVGQGKNVKLGARLEAAGIAEGEPWTWAVFHDAGPVLVRVGRGTGDYADRDEIKRVVAIG